MRYFMKKRSVTLTRLELGLYLSSLLALALSYLLSPKGDILTLTASFIGVTALIFVAKGMVAGQIITVIFAVFYGIVSYCFRYWGEMITYLFMTSPSAIATAIAWMKNPYGQTSEVKVNKLGRLHYTIMLVSGVCVTALLHFVLKMLDTPNLTFGTISVFTSYAASYLTFMRSPYYALAYAANDIVLIVLWVLASIDDTSYIPMVTCFFVFLINDLYGLYNWKRMEKKQDSVSNRI